jgi:hypothetical protein
MDVNRHRIRRIDSKGCQTCQCLPDPATCPAIKCKPCSNGYELDEKGCQTCTCKAAPASACSGMADYASCSKDSTCIWLEPGCDTPALSAAGCYELSGYKCNSDKDCKDGKTCLKRTIDPCAQTDCAACSQTITICL